MICNPARPALSGHAQGVCGDRHASGGFTLLELLLVIGVIAMLMIGITQITRSWINNEAADNAGQHLARISALLERYISTNGLLITSESDDIVADGASGDPDWEEFYRLLEQEGLLDAGGQLRSPMGMALRIAFTIDSSVTPAIHRGTVIATGNLPVGRALQVARYIGTTGGTVAVTPTDPNPANANGAIGAFGQWEIPVAALVPSGLPFPCTRTASRGCVVSVVSHNTDSLCGSYLHREQIPACAHGNIMRTNLNMATNSIQNASEIITDDLVVNNIANLGDTVVSGPARMNGPATVTGGMVVSSGMTVDGNATFNHSVTMIGGGSLNVATLNAHSVRTPALRTNTLDVTDLDVDGQLIVRDHMTVEGDLTVAPAVGGGASTIYANTVNAGRFITTTSGSINAGSMTIENSLAIEGSLQIMGTASQRTLHADRLIAEDCVRIHSIGTDYGNC